MLSKATAHRRALSHQTSSAERSLTAGLTAKTGAIGDNDQCAGRSQQRPVALRTAWDLIHANSWHKDGGCKLYLSGSLRSLSDVSPDDAPAAECWIASTPAQGFKITPSRPAAHVTRQGPTSSKTAKSQVPAPSAAIRAVARQQYSSLTAIRGLPGGDHFSIRPLLRAGLWLRLVRLCPLPTSLTAVIMQLRTEHPPP